MKTGAILAGDNIKIRGLNATYATPENCELIKNRLRKLLLNDNVDISFNAPEPIIADNNNDSTVSCSVYVSHTNLLYYFPEFVYKD